ncbi:MAG TPA: gluconeogenesis factor YvcK family protein [Blastocatellia bacterium]|nr:gluconeogenesis factor YvcK family protein [Blastocatellia bacterium]
MSGIAPIKFVAIGGGTGLSTLLKGLKPYIVAPGSESVHGENWGENGGENGGENEISQRISPRISLTAIVTVTDDGKSSGRLRGEFSVLPPGDIRNCLVALADEDRLITRLFHHRFPGEGAIGGHSLGNLIILALNQMNGCFLQAIDQAGAMLGIKARVLPSTLDRVDLVATVVGGLVQGQMAIKSQNAPIRELRISPPDARALDEAVEAILDADLITLGPGSLFTSIIANLLVRGVADALTRSKAMKIYVCNAMTEFDETDGMKAADHVKHLLAYAPKLKLDYALFNSAPISAEMVERYAAEKAVALDPPTAEDSAFFESGAIQFISLPLISESRSVRHAPEKLSKAIFNIYSRGRVSPPGIDTREISTANGSERASQ